MLDVSRALLKLAQTASESKVNLQVILNSGEILQGLLEALIFPVGYREAGLGKLGILVLEPPDPAFGCPISTTVRWEDIKTVGTCKPVATPVEAVKLKAPTCPECGTVLVQHKRGLVCEKCDYGDSTRDPDPAT